MKKQTKSLESGSLINNMMSNNSSEPIVGEGATLLYYSDRSANEVVEVSNDGKSCKIRKVDTTFIGSSYGDERYTYESNENNSVSELEWNDKKQCWGTVNYSIEIQKSIVNKLFKEHGYGYVKHLPDGHTLESISDVDENGYREFKLIKGITKKYKNFNKVNIIFGIMEEYRDPSF